MPDLHVDVDGSGPTVVLAHGFAGSARNFGPQARALRDRWRIVRYDATGHARSPAPDDPRAYTPEAFVADMAAVLDRVGGAPAVVGGLSMGAATALRFALAHPDRTRGLALAAFPAGTANEGFARVAEEFASASRRTASKPRASGSCGDRRAASTRRPPGSSGRDSSSTAPPASRTRSAA